MTVLTVIRHGPTAWTEAKRIQGHTDVPLSPAGRSAVARWRLPPDMARFSWVSSPLRRARETAELLGAPTLATDPRLREMSWGSWEGRRLADLRRTLGPAMAENEARGLDFRPHGGESPREVQQRLKPWLDHVHASGRPTLAITHNGVIRALLSLATGWTMAGEPPTKPRSAMIHLFDLDPAGRLRLDRLNIRLDVQ
jgi:probable phosphoglycerate mutase